MSQLPEEPPQPKDPVAVATTKILAPYLRAHGFTRLGPRLFGRAKEGIVQWVELVYSPWGGKDFNAACATFPMFAPIEYGGVNSHELGFGFGGMVEYATEGLTEIRGKLETIEMAWLDELWDPLAFRYLMLRRVPGPGSACESLRVSADLAAAMGDLKGARRDARAALAENARDLEDCKRAAQQHGYGPDFWSGPLWIEARLRELLKALDEGRHREMLQRQFQHQHRPAFRRLKGALELPQERKQAS